MPGLRALSLLLLILLAGVVRGEDAAPRPLIQLSDTERAWIAQHPAISAALDDANPPMNVRRPDGSYAGISVDYMRLIARKAGLRLDLVGSSWNEALAKAMRHEVDTIMSASYKEERRTALDFTEPYCETPEAMVTRQDQPAVDSLAAFAGKKVAVVTGTVRVPLLRQQAPGVVISEVDNAGDGMRALAEGRVDAFFDDLPVIQAHIDGMMGSRLHVALLYFQPEAGAQRIGVRNDAPELRSILDKAIAAITPEEHRAIRDRWLNLAAGAGVQRDIGLDEGERAWLSAHPVIRVGCDPDWAPVEWRDASGQWRGVSVDYLTRLGTLLGVRFEIDPATSWSELQARAKAGGIDMFACLLETEERRRDWLFTAPYASFPIAIFARSEIGFLHGLTALNGRRVAVVEGYAEDELVGREFPGLELVRVRSTAEGLERVRHGDVAAYVGGLLTTAFRLQSEGDLSIHVVGETPFAYRQALAVRRDWPMLQRILSKALTAIPSDERETMWRRWVSLSYQRSADLSLLWKIGLPVLLLLLAFIHWNRRLRAEVRQRITAEAELIAYRDRLEDLVRGRTADLESALGRLRRLAAAIDQTAEGVVLASPDGRIEFVNQAFTRITGIAQSEATTLDLARIGLPWDDPALRSGSWRGRIPGRRADGSAYELEVAVSAVNDGDGRLVDLLAVLRDITTSRQIELRLAQSQKLEAVGTLAGGIAHDFNNILGAILGAAELSDRAGLSDERRRALNARIIEACERARSLVRQILTFAKGSLVERHPIELAPVIGEALGLLRSSLPATISFRQSLAPQAWVLGDATRIHQIIMNLGTNAGLAMPSGGVLDVTCEIIAVDADLAAQFDGLKTGPAARITVSDTGVGMTSEVQARIFEPFFTTRPQGQGTGLGLAVVHGIVREFGGAISLASEPGKGTTFTILLPLHDGGGEAVHGTTATATGRGERILVVDDEPLLRQNTSELLGELGYRVTVAADGAEALEMLRRDPLVCDLLVTDSTMPRMTGRDLIAAARTLVPGLRAILCSGQGEVQDEPQPADVRCLAKPVHISELATAIREALAR